MRRGTRAAGAVLAAGLLVAGCGGGGGDDGAGTGTTVAGGSSSGLPIWDENRKMNDMSGYSSPLAKALGFDGSNQNQAEMDAKFKERERKRQELIATCMQAEGFQYTPYVPEQMFSAGGQPPGYDLTRKEYVEKYGFGMSTTFEEMNRPPEPDSMPKPEDDPNFTYVQGLSQTEQEAYNKALYGDMPAMEEPPADEGDGTTAATTGVAYEMGGCMGDAEKDMGGGALSEEDRAFSEDIQKRMEAFYQQVQADKRVVEANRAYATCMADKGFPDIDKQETAYNKVSERMNEIYESMGGGMEVPETDGDGSSAATVVGGDAPQVDQAKLAEIKTYELAVAKADLACGRDVMKTTFEVSQELEQRFVDDNAADLARYKQINDRQGGLG